MKFDIIYILELMKILHQKILFWYKLAIEVKNKSDNGELAVKQYSEEDYNNGNLRYLLFDMVYNFGKI